MFKKLKTIIALMVVLNLLIWNFGVPVSFFIKNAIASGGVSPDYLSEMQGMDIMMATTENVYGVGKFDIFDSSGGTLSSLTVTLMDVPENTSFDPDVDLATLSSASSSGMSLWEDNGDGQFDVNTDTQVGTLSGWSEGQAMFSSIGLTYTANISKRIFLAFKAAVISSTTPKGFEAVVEMGDMVFTGGTIGIWPASYNHFFPPVWIGEAGAGGFGAPLVISEIQTAGGSINDEFIEIYNRDFGNMDLSGWSVKYSSSTDSGALNWGTEIYAFSTTSSYMMQGGGFYLLGNGSLSTTTDVSISADSLAESGGYVGLFNPMGEVMDWVGYGSISDESLAEGGQAAYAPGATSSIERKAFHDSMYSTMITGGIDTDMGNGEDSNNNAMDFILRSTSEPQSSNAIPETPQWGTDGGGSDIIINEIYYKTNSNDGLVELFNRTGDSKSLNNFKLRHKNFEYTFSNYEMTSSSYLIVKWNQGTAHATGTSGYNYIETGNVGSYLDSYGGDLLLLNESSMIMDYVEFGGSGYANESMATNEGQWMAGSYVSHCLDNQSIGRKSTDGEDSNKSDDWQTFSTPSPGSPNMGGDSTAPTAPASVTLSDTDGVEYDLDGRDITISWVPATTQDPSFDRYEIFLLPEGTQLDFNTHYPIDNIYGGQYQYSGGSPLATFTYTGGTFITKDSANTLLTTGSYVAYVLAFDFFGNKSGTAQSGVATLTEEAYNSGDDNTSPFIMHMGVWNAATGSDLHLIARADDDRMMDATNPLRIVWEVGTDFNFDLVTGATTDNCTLIQAKFYDCVISWDSGWNEDKVIGYYLKALDDAGNESFMSSSPDDDMSGDEANVQTSPFYIDIMPAPNDAGDEADLTGNTYKWDGNILASTTIIFEGMAIAPVASNASGTFAFPDNIIDDGMYHVMALREGYMDMVNSVFKGDSINFYLNEGDINMGGMTGDGGANPIVMWTAPFDNMMGAPIDIFCTGDCTTMGDHEESIIIAFDRPMNGSTINDQNAADSSSNIYLTTNGSDRVNGKVYYDATMQQAIFYAEVHDTLALGTYYSLVVTQGVTDEFGSPISGMNSDGSFSNGFTTFMSMSDTDDYADFGGGGANMPPYVMGTNPYSGQFNVARNASIIIEFSEPMDSSKISTGVNGTINLVPIIDSSAWVADSSTGHGSPVAATVSLDQATRRIVTLSPNSPLSDSYDWWVIKVMGDARSSTFMYIADPMSVGGCADWDVCSELNSVIAYQSNFQINTGDTDTTPPTVMGTYPNNNDGITASTNPIDVGIGALEIGFSEAMDPGTIDSNNIKLLAGSSVTGGKVSYDPMSNNAKLMPYTALLANTQYTLRINADCSDLSGNKLNATTSVYFKTGVGDTQAPEVMYANGDDYSIAITFNEPMNAAKQTDTTNWAYSVLNPANYAVNGLTPDGSCEFPGSWSCNPTIIAPYNDATGTPLTGLSLSFSYEDYNNTVIIEGFQFGSSATDFQIFIDNVRDKSNNEITDSGNRAGESSHLNAARAPMYNSTETYGALVPGATDVNMDMGDMGMMMAGAFPMNAMAGQQSMYFIDVPTTKSIPIGGKIMITFPAGFDVTNAAKDIYSPVNNDINEWNLGVVTIDSVTGNQAARTVTIVASTSATQAYDFLHMDIKGIVNASIPKDFGTEGYTVDIKTFTADGALLETVYTMPFFITEGGTNSISGEIHGVLSGDSDNMTVFLGSPMTGHMETEVAVVGTGDGDLDGAYSFTNLPNGEYFIFTEPSITIGDTNYFGSMHPEPLWLNNSSTTKDITLTPETSGGAEITISLTGDFSTNSVPDNVDIFAGSPSGFRVKTLTNVGSVNGTTTSLYLSTGDWMVGIGPAMPKNSMSGPPPMPDWMPPMNVFYYSDGETAGDLSFDISNQTAHTISGTVVDGAGNGIADAEVYAYQPMGGFGGSHTKTAINGAFTLKIPVLGIYVIGAFKPGLPEPKENVENVTGDVTEMTIKMLKPDYTISGKVLNSSGNAVAYAPVWAWQENSWGHSDTMTDSAGNYILYVSPGTWHVEADAPGVGWMEYGLWVTISDTSAANINISPAAGTDYYTISGRVGISTNETYSVIDTPFINMPIRAVLYNANGVYQGKEYNSTTNSNGEYTISVPAGIYRVDIWTQEYGELGVNNQAELNDTLNEAGIDDKYANNPANVNAVSGNVSDANIVVAQTGLRDVLVTVTNAQASQEGFLNIEGVDFTGDFPEPNGFYMSRRVNDLSATTTIQLADGDYLFFLDVPGYGSYIPDADDRHVTKDDIVVSGDRTVNFTLPDSSSEMSTISGTVYGGSISGGNELGDAWVWVGNPSNGYHNGSMTASSGAYSIVVPTGTGYKIGADKPGYMSNEPSSLDATSDVSGQNIVLNAYSLTISGYIYSDANSNSSYDSGEGVPNGFVRAETTECNDSDTSNDASCKRSHTPVDGTGFYELGVVNGTWEVYGMADSYLETEYGSNITISGSSAASKHIKLTTDANWTTKSKKKPITPASGGSLDDTDSSGTGIKLTIPPNALGSSNSSGNVNAKKTSAVTKTNSSDPVGGTGVTVTATDNSGQAITNLDDYVDIEMVIYKAEIDTEIAAGNLTYAKLKNTNNGYWDSTSDDWVNMATTKKAYYSTSSNATNWILYASSTEQISAFENFINQIASGTLSVYDYKLVYTSKTNHFTIFAVIMPFIAVAAEPDPEPTCGDGSCNGDETCSTCPADCGSCSSSGGGGSYTSYCTSVEYMEWSDCIDGAQTRDVLSKTPVSCRLTTAQEEAKSQICSTVEEGTEAPEIILFNADAQNQELSLIDVLYLEQGEMILRAEVAEILPIMNRERKHEQEYAARDTLIKKLEIDLNALEARHQYALTNFIAYGSPDTEKLGAGERAGVINSFRATFKKVPETSNDWSDVIKIANGRWPSAANTEAEAVATDAFVKVYLRFPDRNDSHDDAAVVVVAYGLRPANRNTDSEKAAIKTFKSIYGYNPAGATDWDIVRAIAYSGAIRQPDADKDLLSDAYEAILGTDPNKPDTDGDGYDDGEEVKNGHNPLEE
ncbi:Ig-like domain-containing protein [Candidatus Parcubacteria bacterium]|nr:Ig-like domain-containing protein [Candidatus Parcubacteria bacterium]